MGLLILAICVLDTGGYFTVNERYFPEETANPFLKDLTILRALELDEDTDAPPVKYCLFF